MRSGTRGSARNQPEEPVVLAPTPERARKSHVVRLSRQIADDEGRPSVPYLSVDVLETMARAGTVSGEMYAAALRFREGFYHAGLDPLRAANISDSVNVGRGHFERFTLPWVEQKRTQLRCQIAALGGDATIAARILVHVLGFDGNFSSFAALHTPIQGNRSAARGAFVAALDLLAAHFESCRCCAS